MEGLCDESVEVARGRDPVSQTTYRDAASLDLLPVADNPDPPRPPETAEENLREEVKIGDECTLEDDTDVRGVEQFDREGRFDPSYFLVHQLYVYLEPLEVYHQTEDEHSRE